MQQTTEIEDVEQGVQQVCQQYGTPMIIVTLGKRGCYYKVEEKVGSVEGYKVQAVDTTGAGDAFLGAFLSQVLDFQDMRNIDHDELRRAIWTANVAGALATVKKGAIDSLPSLEELASHVIENEASRDKV